MIGVAGENRHRPVDLFGGHDSRQLMRESHRPKRQNERSLVADLGAKAVRTADDERERWRARIAALAKMGGKIAAAKKLAGFVEGNEIRARLQGRENRPRLVGFAILRSPRPAFVQFAQFNAGKTNGAAGGIGAFDIAKRKLSLRAGFRAADAKQDKPH